MGFRVDYPILAPTEGEIVPSGRCPYCKRHTIFVTINPLNNEGRPREIGVKNGSISLAQCQHRDCRAIVYREFAPNNDEQQYDIYPPVELEADAELEDPVKRSFEAALTVFQEGHWNPACQALGRALQDASAQLCPPDVKRESWLATKLYPRIETLASKHLIPESLRQWAQEARTLRVYAEHGDEFGDYWATEAEAKEMMEFTKWFLRYALVLPRQLATRKARLAEEAKKPPAKQS